MKYVFMKIMVRIFCSALLELGVRAVSSPFDSALSRTAEWVSRLRGLPTSL